MSTQARHDCLHLAAPLRAGRHFYGAAPVLVALVFAAAALVLAVEPVLWLVNSWVDPSYDSSGLIVFALAAGLFLWSVTSPLASSAPAPRSGTAAALLVTTALVRLAGQVAAVNMIGAVCLVLDVYAIGLMCRLRWRARALSPGWLAVVFAFSLPLERVLQRSIGYALQELSARGACEVLSTLYADLACHGVRLIVGGADVLVDLPCSGARALLVGLLGFAIAAAVCRPRPGQALLGAAATVAATGLANVLRISTLAVGIAEPARLGGIDVLAEPWHDLIGLVALTIPCLTVGIWASRCRPAPLRSRPVRPALAAPRRLPGLPAGLPAGLAALALALVIVTLPRTAIDVSKVPDRVPLPLTLDGQQRHPVALSAREAAYFVRYGGWAAKAEYGPMGLLVTRTTSPLRHLHAPKDCLRGLGFEVSYLGAAFEPVPTAFYRAVAPDGRRYRIAVSFLAEDGRATYNVATAIWHWLTGEARVWTAVQRIAPETLPPEDQARFSRAVLAALDLGSPNFTPTRTPHGRDKS